MTHQADDPTLFLTIKELAVLTGQSAKTLHSQAAKGILPLPTLKFGSRYLIPRKAIEDLVGPIALRGQARVSLPTRY
ncbi:MAG: helix-turn-helix domain-containing protein [Chloroflexia bacterium]|nr:helix-turn-helix domain-containing protein [Chloroflexia bacterium]